MVNINMYFNIRFTRLILRRRYVQFNKTNDKRRPRKGAAMAEDLVPSVRVMLLVSGCPPVIIIWTGQLVGSASCKHNNTLLVVV